MGNCFGGEEGPKKTTTTEKPKEVDNKIKLLLLGAGESGKSTIFKQVRMKYVKKYNEKELKGFKIDIKRNMIESMFNLVRATSALGETIGNDHKNFVGELLELDDDDEALMQADKLFTPEFAGKLKKLWGDKAIQNVLPQRSKFQLYDSTEYFYNKIDEIGKSDYIPSFDDLLRTRVKTTGINNADFTIDGNEFRLFDVGGQRNERKKWIKCFDHVKAVLFVVSLAEYDLKCYEDDETMRMTESLQLFQGISNNTKYFEGVPIILIFNKVDLFKEKIKKVDLKVLFDEYDGGKDYEKATAFIEKQFRSKCEDNSKTIAVYKTCATQSEDIERVFDDFIRKNKTYKKLS